MFVTPCVGVWIETWQQRPSQLIYPVTPCVGVWIETFEPGFDNIVHGVTPCVGVWIETYHLFFCRGNPRRHTLRGCVD